VEAEAERSFCFVYVMAHAARDGDRQSGLGFSAGREPDELDPGQAGREAAEKARVLLGASPCPTGCYTVVFDREVAAALLSSIVQALSADAVQKGRSVFEGRLGDTVASPLLTLRDDGLAPEGMASNPFDGEGAPQRTTALLDAGVLQAYLHNSYTASKAAAGTISTGNAGRSSYRSLPGVDATNLVLRPGKGGLDDLLSRVGEGLYVASVAGLHSGVNAISGEVSLGVNGRLIKDGSPGRSHHRLRLRVFVSFSERCGWRCSLDPAPRECVHALCGGTGDRSLGDLITRAARRRDSGRDRGERIIGQIAVEQGLSGG
jgi:PmbA protein